LSSCFPHAGSLFLCILIVAFTNAYPNIVNCNSNLDSTEIMMGYNIVEYDDADIKIHLEVKADEDEQWTSRDLYQLKDNGPNELKVRLILPESLKNDPYDTTMFLLETTQGAKFAEGRCDGRRANGMDESSELVLNVNNPSNTIYILGAWAHGYEPVKLTAKFQLSLSEAEL